VSLHPVEPGFPTSSAASPSAELRGRWLLLARAGWVAVVLLVVGLFVAAVPARYDQIVTLSNLPEDIDSTILRTNLADAGLSIRFYATYHLVMEICFAAVCLTLAAVIFRRRSDERMALFVALLLVLLGTTFWGTTDALSLYHPAGSWVSESLDAVGKMSLFLFFYLFPDGRFVPHWTRYLALTMIAGVISGIIFPGTPLAVSNWPVPLLLLFMLGWLLIGVFAQIYRYRRVSGPVQRQQTKWVLFGFAGALVGFLGVIFFGEVLFSLAEPGTRGELVGMTIMTLSMLLIPLSIGAAILRHRLFDIDVVINRTLVYGALTACIVGIYVLVVGYLGSLLKTDGNLAISLVATGVVAVLFAPLRERLQLGVNRLMYGERDDPYAAVSRLGERLEATLAPEEVLPRIVETVREALKLPYAAIALPRDGADFEVAAASGEKPPADLLVLHLSYGGESVGRLLLAPRAPGEGFSSADRSLLDSLARHAGVAVHGVRVMADLRRSRERLVLAREEERRRLRRDLHDELAPTLAALGLSAATVSELIPVDPEGAASANEKLRATIRATVGDVRRLVYDLRPPALDELGLVEAVRERASRYSAHEEGFRVKVEAPDELPPLPAAVEVAAYRIVQEALTNVSRHAKARSCTVRLACPNGRTLEVEVTDDGVGLPDTPEGGVGLSSMRERAVELGGACETMLASPSGTRVFARLPLGEPPLEGPKE
jgi:signal transduction histidine kinase